VHEWYRFHKIQIKVGIYKRKVEGNILRKETVNRGSHQRNAASIRIANTSVACARELSRIEDFAKADTWKSVSKRIIDWARNHDSNGMELLRQFGSTK